MNPHSIEQLPWDTSLAFKKNITPYLVVLVTFFACYSTITTLFNALGVQDTKGFTKQATGSIVNIEYSSLRVGNAPRFKVTVNYCGITKAFDYIDDAVQFHFGVGDEVVIEYDPKDVNRAHLNLQKSIEQKSSRIPSNAKFKVLEINPDFSQKSNHYEILGELHREGNKPQQALIKEVLSDSQLEGFIPGKVIPCLVEGEEGNLKISL